MMKFLLPFRYALLSLFVMGAMQTVSAQQPEQVQELETIVVTAQAEEEKKVAETVKTAKQLTQEMVNDSRDLVRYNTEIDIAEIGRYGSKGFAMRGVDGNRIAMNIDGVALPDVETNEIFSPYGYMYEGRLSPDLESMGQVKMTVGADSLSSGSGAVGGSVAYHTKEPADLVREGEQFGGYTKLGYSNKNDEKLFASGLAFKGNRFETLFNYAQRQGNETKNHAMRKADKARLEPTYIFTAEEMPASNDTSSLIYPNPQEYKRESMLGKLYYHFNDKHRVGIHGLYQKQTNHLNTESTSTTASRTWGQTRRAHDIEKLENYGVNYRYKPNDSSILDELNLDYTKSNSFGLADTWIYDRQFNWRDDSLQSVNLSHREYRPTETETKQTTLALQSLPLNFGKLGEHQFKLSAQHSKQDYTSSATYLSNSSYINDHLSYAFPDAEKRIYHLSLQDKIRFNDRFKAELGVRYDNFKYRPYYQDDVNGLSEITRNNDVCKNSSNTTLYCQLHRNGQGLSDSKFSHTTWQGLLDYQLIPDRFTARYKIGTGFLAPTVSQIYSTFEGLGVRQVPNYSLKPEKSLNQELELEWKANDAVTMSVSGYLSKYQDFIHTRFWRGATNGCSASNTCLQSMNLDDATVMGLKLGTKVNLSHWLNLAGDLSLFADYHIAKDSANIALDSGETAKINTLASVPNTLILGADYIAPNQDWTLHTRLRAISGKKSKETKTLETRPIESVTTTVCPSDIASYGYCGYYGYSYDRTTGQYTKTSTEITGYEEYVDTYKHIDQSQSAVLIDVFGSKKFGRKQQLSLNAGVYNLTNVKYIPWESLRMFNTVNTNQMVGQDGYGFARYTAPGRNFAVSLTYEF